MVDHNDTLPEGTDKIIAGAAATQYEEELIVSEPTTPTATSTTATAASATAATNASANASGNSKRNQVIGKVKIGSEKLSGQAADKARGLVGQGLTRSSEALASVSKMIGDTATGIDERIGSEYGDYARKAATTLDDVANKLASKDADELIDDTRGFVRKSPGIALAGAAIVGFALARLVKSGLDADKKA